MAEQVLFSPQEREGYVIGFLGYSASLFHLKRKMS
jgi:hypothetical protein